MKSNFVCAIIIVCFGVKSFAGNDALQALSLTKKAYPYVKFNEENGNVKEDPLASLMNKGKVSELPYDLVELIGKNIRIDCSNIELIQSKNNMRDLNHCLIERGLEWIKELMIKKGDTLVHPKSLLNKGLPPHGHILGKLRWFDNTHNITEIFNVKLFDFFTAPNGISDSRLLFSLQKILKSVKDCDVNSVMAHEATHELLSFLAGFMYIKLKLKPPLMMILEEPRIIKNSHVLTRSANGFTTTSTESSVSVLSAAVLSIGNSLKHIPAAPPNLELALEKLLEHGQKVLAEHVKHHIIELGVRSIFEEKQYKSFLMTDLDFLFVESAIKNAGSKEYFFDRYREKIYHFDSFIRVIFSEKNENKNLFGRLIKLWFILFDKKTCLVSTDKLSSHDQSSNKLYKVDKERHVVLLSQEGYDKALAFVIALFNKIDS